MTTSATTARPRPTLTALRAAHMFDGTGALPDPTVIIDGAVILAAGRGLPVPDGAQVIDMPGATILPGLVDGHVHLMFDASDDPVGHLAARDDAAAFAAAAGAARRAAQGGVTTVRDLGDRGFLVLGLRDAARTDTTLPNILAAGPPITTPGGHCHFLGASAAGADGISGAIRERADRGVDVIKIMASGGNMTPGSRPELAQYTRDELRAAVAEAHRHGLAITAHAHGTSAITDAAAAGMDGLEHVSFMTADGVDEIPGELLATLGRGELVLSLTFGIAPVAGAGPPPGVLARMPALIANAQRMHRAGARIIVGSDAGLGPAKPPDAVRYALPQLQQIGMSPAQALHTCTARAASALGLGDHKGRIAPGYDADILVVDGNPLTDPAAIHRIRAVYLRGTALPDGSP
jgi:imidazolonepropionase-like amidohydrolase